MVSHSRMTIFLMAEVAVLEKLFLKVSIAFLVAKLLEKLYRKSPSSPDDFNAWMLKRTLLYAILLKSLRLKSGIAS